jgi:hypothetical protein
MKTIFTTKRVFIEDNTQVETVRDISFFLDNVQLWERMEAGVFNEHENITICRMECGDSYCLKIEWSKFNQIMKDFINQQGDIIIQMKQN